MIYGLHHCLNVVTEREGYPAAVLIRAIELHTGLVDGPGHVCRALRIDRRFNRLDLTQGRMLWIEEIDGRETESRPIRESVWPTRDRSRLAANG